MLSDMCNTFESEGENETRSKKKKKKQMQYFRSVLCNFFSSQVDVYSTYDGNIDLVECANK